MSGFINENDRGEFIGSIIDIFDDFLQYKGIEIPNEEKEVDCDAAIIYGIDYDLIRIKLEKMMAAWSVIDS